MERIQALMMLLLVLVISSGARGQSEELAADAAPAAAPEEAAPDAAAPDAAATDAVPQPAGAADSLELHGAFSTRYRVRWGDGESDNDLSQHLRMGFGDERETGFSGSFFGRLTEDLDGRGDSREFFLFRSLTDSAGDAVNGKIYTGYVNYRPESTPISQVRVGRQYFFAGDQFQMDGVRLSLRPAEKLGDLTLDGFVGVPSHMYEASPDGDFVAGGSARLVPWESGVTNLSYVHIDDKNHYYGRRSNDLFTFTHDQQFGENVSALGTYQHLNGKAYHVGANVQGLVPELDLLITGVFDSTPTRQKSLVYDIDPYYGAAYDLAPYWTGSVAAAKGLGDNATLEAGVSWRTLFRGEDEGEYNREYTRVFTTLSLDNFLDPTISTSITGELYSGEGDDTGALTFEAEWRPTDTLRFVAGTDYALYRYDLLSESERHDSQGAYLRVRWLPSDAWRFDSGLRIEHDDFGTYGNFNMGLEFGW